MYLKLLPALLLGCQVHAATIDLGEDRTSSLEGFAYSDLNGITTNKQFSFDLLFNKNVHVLKGTTFFSVGLDFQCSPTNFLTGTASLLDFNGQVITSGVMGSFITDDGFMVAGFYPFITSAYDFYGVHFDLNVPETDILKGEFYLSGQLREFRIGSFVPDEGSTVTLLLITLVFLFFFYDPEATS